MKQRLQVKLTLLTTNRNSDILLMHTVVSNLLIISSCFFVVKWFWLMLASLALLRR